MKRRNPVGASQNRAKITDVQPSSGMALSRMPSRTEGGLLSSLALIFDYDINTLHLVCNVIIDDLWTRRKSLASDFADRAYYNHGL
jgi:hypothetical protein